MSVNFPEEITRLEAVEEKLHNALAKLDETIAGHEKEYREGKRYLTANWNEIDSLEKFSNERSLMLIENAGNLTLERRTKIEKLINAPYFARIDFRYQEEPDAEPIYIGPFSFTDGSNQMLIYDWRAPISSMYYDYELGPASYEAPMGTIAGDIVLKRQFKIKNEQMEYALESAVNIDDDILQRELSSTSDEKMKTIIATIQKEQNKIIRNDKADTLVIQGVAGSGKTSIALHRVAYLLYRYKNQIAADNVVIISPNKVFADYISNVLPELGEEPILETSFEEIAQTELSGLVKFKRFTDQMERLPADWLERSSFKSSPAFIALLEEYLEYANHTFFVPQECVIGHFVIPKDYLWRRYDAYRNRPIYHRFAEMADDILDRIMSENIRGYKLPGRKQIIKKLIPMFKIKSTLELYAGFYHYIKKPELFVLAGKDQLEWPDVFPCLYCKDFLEGIEKFRTIRHLVIDEMQDYTPIQYAVINRMFSCKKTILGDFGQAVNPYNRHSPEAFKAIFDPVDFIELTKSYRSTYEIMEFAKKIQNTQRIEPVKRHGEEPGLVRCDNWRAELAAVKENITAFLNGKYATLGILCKNSRLAKKLHQELSGEYAVYLLDDNSDAFKNGITITTIFMSKGLEFDEVIIPCANAEMYSSEYDRSLLYVACTRAMHKLMLSYHGNVTKFLETQEN